VGSNHSLAERTVSRIKWRLLPFLGVLYVVSYLDRVNVSFAKLTMNASIGIDDATYAFGAGIFFIGYFLFEVPSNLILERVGARRWIARIMITWGIISAATAFVTGPASFVTMRFLLGVAEAGFFPGILLYLTYWFPAHERARVVGLFMVALPL
jgi:ACS family tartrate transporter-like MFS transporter